MVTIRLTRRGGKKDPFYHVVVADSRSRQGGATLEQVGFFDPIARGKETALRLDVAKIDSWISKGAKASARVQSLLLDYRKQLTADASAAA
ncbi:MAG: 30S ribosomal protein S16 [Pseudomonadota bacterium]|jgi:small subunit ribosomal protein S16